MWLESYESRIDNSSLDDKQKESVKKYIQSRDNFISQDHTISEKTRQQMLDMELNGQLQRLEAPRIEQGSDDNENNECTNIEQWLTNLDESKLEDMLNDDYLENFEFDEERWFDSIEDIEYQAVLYTEYNNAIYNYQKELWNLYSQLMSIVQRFNQERDEDTFWKKSSGYEKQAGPINDKISYYRRLFKNVENKIHDAVIKSYNLWADLDQAPDNLRKKELEHQEVTEWQYEEQNKKLNEKLNAYQEHKQELNQTSKGLWNTKTYLDSQSKELEQASNVLKDKEQQIDSVISDCDTKISTFQNIVRSVCVWVLPFSDQELRVLLMNPDYFINNQFLRERANAAQNLIQAYWSQLQEYIQIIDNYQALIKQREQLWQAEQDVTNRQDVVNQSISQVTKQKQIVDDENVANDNRIAQTEQDKEKTEKQRAEAMDYYFGHVTNIGELDRTVSEIIMDTNMQNDKIEQATSSIVCSLEWLKVEEKWFLEELWDSTLGWLWKILKSGCERVKGNWSELADWICSWHKLVPWLWETWLWKAFDTTVHFCAGITEWAWELVGWLCSILEKPVSTVKAIGTLVWLDIVSFFPPNLNFSLGRAWDARLNFWKAIINYDERWKWYDAEVAWKTTLNILSFFIPEVWAAKSAAQLARVSRGASYLKCTGIFAYEFGKWAIQKFGNIWKWLYRTVAHPVETCKMGLWYMGEHTYLGSTYNLWKKRRNIGKDTITHWPGYAASQYLAGTYPWMWINWLARMRGAVPLFWRKFPTFKNIPKKLSEINARIERLAWKPWRWKTGKNWVNKGWEIDEMYQTIRDYVDLDGNILAGKDIPRNKWWDIARYQSALQELKALQAAQKLYQSVESNIENLAKTSPLILKNKQFTKLFEEMLRDPSISNMTRTFEKFAKKNPILAAWLHNTEIFKIGEVHYFVESWKLVPYKLIRWRNWKKKYEPISSSEILIKPPQLTWEAARLVEGPKTLNEKTAGKHYLEDSLEEDDESFWIAI